MHCTALLWEGRAEGNTCHQQWAWGELWGTAVSKQVLALPFVLSHEAIKPHWEIHHLALALGGLTEVVLFMGRIPQVQTKPASSKMHHEALIFQTGLMVHFGRNIERMKHESASCSCREFTHCRSQRTHSLS